MKFFNIFKGKKVEEDAVGTTSAAAPSTTGNEPTPCAEKVTQHPAPCNAVTVHNLIILDESGSMSSIYQPALTGLNETLQTIRAAQDEHPEQTHIVHMVSFNTRRMNDIYKNTPAKDAIDITKKQYCPNGCTPLYDAMGNSLNRLRQIAKTDDIVLVTIITDGYENASREFSGPAIKAMVESLKKEGWTFTYIGANQDVEAVAASLSIRNSLCFSEDEEGTAAMFEKECRSRKVFFGKISKGMSKQDLADEDYFAE